MGFKLVEYKELRDKLVACAEELAKRCVSPREFIDAFLKGTPNAKNITKKYSTLSEPRQTQLGLLLTMIRLLDAVSLADEQKKLILNAVAFHIRDLIQVSYDPKKSWANYLASYGTSVNSSKLYVSLGFALNILKDNAPTNKDMRSMCAALKYFVQKQIYNNEKDSLNGYAPGADDFSDKKIPQFNVEVFLMDLSDKIMQLDKLLILEAPPKSHSLFFSAADTLPAACSLLARRDSKDFQSSVSSVVF